MGPLVYTSGNETRNHHPLSLKLASMGPLVYTSGNGLTRAAIQAPRNSFNGAAGLHQRKLC